MTLTKRHLDSARTALRKAKAEQSKVNRQVTHLQRLVDGLTTVLDKPFNAQTAGLTETIRLAMKIIGEPMTATEVRRQIEALGYEWKNPKHGIIAVHTVLQRLINKHDVVSQIRKDANGTESVVYRSLFEDERLGNEDDPF